MRDSVPAGKLPINPGSLNAVAAAGTASVSPSTAATTPAAAAAIAVPQETATAAGRAEVGGGGGEQGPSSVGRYSHKFAGGGSSGAAAKSGAVQYSDSILTVRAPPSSRVDRRGAWAQEA